MPHSRIYTSRYTQEGRLLNRRSRWRQMRASVRDTFVLFREFQWAILFFSFIIFAGAWSFQYLWNLTFPDDPVFFFESLYNMLLMVFFQPPIAFPEQWYLEIYLFIMPLFGLIALTRGLAEFTALLFNRELRQSKWEEAVASTFNNHIIICGLGHVGLRVIHELILLNEDIVVIEANPDSPRFEELRPFDIPIIVGDGRSPDILMKAGVMKANSLIVCTNDDLMNLKIASQIRDLNSKIKLIVRMFDDQFARSVAEGMNIDVIMSASGLAAPAFAGAATGTEIIQTFAIEDQQLVMGRIEVKAGSRIEGQAIHVIEDTLDLTVVLYHSRAGMQIHPDSESILRSGDIVAVVGELDDLQKLSLDWNRG